ncbi:DNA polymerase III delta subunit [Anaerobacterium chartisolvens]|uniref:DNA polymerase III subunit delta n=1 Tax=Anaerobacterium chartisolvens TaxID=1297424 RepID=A0A369B569_9FIRM|nr:DNA polymerase III subunit delta [Anaerobacterium chartisolvens]RCX16633.1 DNA polymerase III delta subunit [Anaerobacterium chartisolvens]
MSIDILKEDIKSGMIRSLYLFYGQEEYLKRYYVDCIEKQIIAKETRALNRLVMDGGIDIRKLSEACETMPVFSDRKLVVVKNSEVFKAKKKPGGAKGKSKGSSGDELLEYLQNIPPYTCLIFYEDSIDKRIKAVDSIKKNGLIVECAFQKPAELVKWAIKVFKSYGKDIDRLTASKLVDSSEQGMTEILNEIDKVALYIGDRTAVTGEDISRVCTPSIKSRVFDLTDAIAEKNAGRAFKLLNDMAALKEPMPKILFMIARQFRQVLELKLLTEEGLDLGQAASKMGITPYAAGKLIKQARHFTQETLKQAMEESLKMDVAIKTGKIKDRIAAEMLIARFAQD